MFFFLSKTLGFMLLPTNFLIGAGVLGAILSAARLVSIGRRLLIASVVLLAICGFSPLGNWLLYPLEQRFPPWDAARGEPDGIIILGGSIDTEVSAASSQPRLLRADIRTPASCFPVEIPIWFRMTRRRKPITRSRHSKASALPGNG